MAFRLGAGMPLVVCMQKRIHHCLCQITLMRLYAATAPATMCMPVMRVCNNAKTSSLHIICYNEYRTELNS